MSQKSNSFTDEDAKLTKIDPFISQSSLTVHQDIRLTNAASSLLKRRCQDSKVSGPEPPVGVALLKPVDGFSIAHSNIISAVAVDHALSNNSGRNRFLADTSKTIDNLRYVQASLSNSSRFYIKGSVIHRREQTAR